MPWGKRSDGSYPSVNLDTIRLVQALPNLKALVIKAHSRRGDPFHPLDFIPQALESLCVLKKDHLYVPFSQLIDFLESHPSIVYLDPPSLYLPVPNASTLDDMNAIADLVDQRKICLPALREFICHSFGSRHAWIIKLPPTTFPNLTKIVLTPCVDDSEAINNMKQFLAHLGRNLSSLELKTYYRSLSQVLPQWLAILNEFCPHLRELGVHTPFVNPRNMPVEPPCTTVCQSPTITKLAFHNFSFDFGYNELSEEELRAELLCAVLEWTESFPRLETLALVSEHNVDDLRSEVFVGTFASFLEECRRRRLDVVDNFGVCLNP